MKIFEGLSKGFGDKAVFSDFSLEVPDGKITVIMGESGGGKTTLLKIAAGLLDADKGTVTVRGKTAIMFQEPRLLPSFSVYDNILAVVGKENSALADKYLALCEIYDSRDKYPAELSGGMAQRASFARFLAYSEISNAELLLLDEPFSALDEPLAERMISVLRASCSGKTVIAVMHNRAQAELLSDNIVTI